MTRGTRTSACIGLVLVLVAVGCSSADESAAPAVPAPATTGSSAPAPTTSDEGAPPTSSAPSSSADVETSPPAGIADVLNRAGIALVASPVPVVTDAIFTLTESQAQYLADEAGSGSGTRGADLDAAGGGATSGLPMSAVLAGYVRGVDTAGAEYSRSLLLDQDLTHPEQVVFPTIVLALFAADAATAFAADEIGVSEPATSGGIRGGGGASRGVRVGICSDVTKSIFDAVDKIFAKIHIPPGRVGNTGSKFLNGLLQGLTDVVVAGLNFVIDAARTLVVGGIEFVLGQVLSIVAEVAAAAALVTNFVSAVRLWGLGVVAKDPNTRKGVDSEHVYDRVTATAIIIGPDDDWPAWFVDCAKVAGVDLPSPLPVDAPVTWKVESRVPSADLINESEHEVRKDTKLRKDGSSVLALLGLVTGTESKEQAKGDEQHGAVIVTATARRNQIEELRKTLVTAVNNLAATVLGKVPALIKDFLLSLVRQATEGGSEQVASLLDASGKALIDVKYHGPPKPEKTPPTGGAWSFAFYSNGSVAPTLAGYTCSGLLSTWHVIFGAGSPELERTYDLPFSAATTTAHHDLVYDFPPAGTSGAVHVEWRWDYVIDTSVTPPMIRLSGTQHETPAGQGELVFDNNFGTGDGIVLENKSLPQLLEGQGLSHPFLTQAAAECG